LQVSAGKQRVSPGGAPKASPTVCPPMAADDDLRAVIDAWPLLPTALRDGIIAMVEAAIGDTPTVTHRLETGETV
jgi:hypothetical protein